MNSQLMRTGFALSALLATLASARAEDAAIAAEFKKLDGEWTAPSMAGGDVVYRLPFTRVVTVAVPQSGHSGTLARGRPSAIQDIRL